MANLYPMAKFMYNVNTFIILVVLTLLSFLWGVFEIHKGGCIISINDFQLIFGQFVLLYYGLTPIQFLFSITVAYDL